MNKPTTADIEKLMGKLRQVLPCRIDYNTGHKNAILYIYLIKDKRVFYRLDFDLREGLNYGLVIGMCKKALEGELQPNAGGFPYPVWRQVYRPDRERGQELTNRIN